jgi:hypothetical protein
MLVDYGTGPIDLGDPIGDVRRVLERCRAALANGDAALLADIDTSIATLTPAMVSISGTIVSFTGLDTLATDAATSAGPTIIVP